MTEQTAREPQASANEAMQPGETRCQPELSALRESEAAWRDVFHSAPVALCLASASDGRVRAVNARYAELLGATPDALSGRLMSELHLLPADSDAESIARDLAEQSNVVRIANHCLRSDGTLRDCVSSMRLVQRGAETLILSSTHESSSNGSEAALAAQTRRVRELETEIAAYRAQEQRLIRESGELCAEASLLKSDIVKLKQMQQELSSEMDNLRKHAVLAASIAAAESAATTGTEPGAAMQPLPASARSAGDPAGTANDALWELASARLHHVEEQLIKHAAALSEQAGHMQDARAGA